MPWLFHENQAFQKTALGNAQSYACSLQLMLKDSAGYSSLFVSGELKRYIVVSMSPKEISRLR